MWFTFLRIHKRNSRNIFDAWLSFASFRRHKKWGACGCVAVSVQIHTTITSTSIDGHDNSFDGDGSGDGRGKKRVIWFCFYFASHFAGIAHMIIIQRVVHTRTRRGSREKECWSFGWMNDAARSNNIDANSRSISCFAVWFCLTWRWRWCGTHFSVQPPHSHIIKWVRAPANAMLSSSSSGAAVVMKHNIRRHNHPASAG